MLWLREREDHRDRRGRSGVYGHKGNIMMSKNENVDSEEMRCEEGSALLLSSEGTLGSHGLHLFAVVSSQRLTSWG